MDSIAMPGTRAMVWFIGAGPGDPELITVKGERLIREADLVLYAGSLVPAAIVARARPGAEVLDSSSLTLEETHALMRKTALSGRMTARVHTGDPSLYGAIREQMALLRADGIPYAVVPGVSAAFAAAAAAGVSFTVPECVQSLSFARLGGRTPVPEGQRVADYARHGASLAVYLSAGDADALIEELRCGGLQEETTIIAAYRVGWPEERLIRTTLAGLRQSLRELDASRQTVFLILPGEQEATCSRLYAKEFRHGFRR